MDKSFPDTLYSKGRVTKEPSRLEHASEGESSNHGAHAGYCDALSSYTATVIELLQSFEHGSGIVCYVFK